MWITDSLTCHAHLVIDTLYGMGNIWQPQSQVVAGHTANASIGGDGSGTLSARCWAGFTPLIGTTLL